MTKRTSVLLHWLALTSALIPLITIHSTYLLSAYEGLVPWCLPWFEGCTSISRASRSGAAYFVFKGAMLPSIVLIMLYWWANRFWLLQLGGKPGYWWWLGVCAAFLLVLYTVALGHIGPAMHGLRRIGAVGFFGLTFIAQVGLGAALLRGACPVLGRVLLGLSLFTLMVGLSSVLVNIFWPARHSTMEDSFEWSLAVLLNAHSLIVAWGWWRSGFALYFTVGLGPKNK